MHAQFSGFAATGKAPTALAPLTALPRWVLWQKKTIKGKPTKVPYQPDGTKASSTDPTTWCDFKTAMGAVNGYDGIGFVLTNSNIAAFDIDDCRNATTGVVHPWADELV